MCIGATHTVETRWDPQHQDAKAFTAACVEQVGMTLHGGIAIHDLAAMQQLTITQVWGVGHTLPEGNNNQERQPSRATSASRADLLLHVPHPA
jgi:hypothetical protein